MGVDDAEEEILWFNRNGFFYILDRVNGQFLKATQYAQKVTWTKGIDPKTGKRRNLGTFRSRAAAEKHEREIQYFKRR